MALETNERRQRSKRCWGLPYWLRSPVLLKWTLRMAVFAYRFWRLWNYLTGETGD